MNRWKKYLLLAQALAFALSPSGCVSPFGKEVRKQVNKKVPVAQVLADPNNYKGRVIMIGGRIVETVPKGETTEMIVLQLPLGTDYSPARRDESSGRFILIAKGFLDPAVYSRGREITAVAEVVGLETRNIGEKPYGYAVLKALQIKLWPRSWAYYPPAYWDPFWGPYFGPSFWGPYWWEVPPHPPHHRR